jgi:hypothetical protein
LTLNSLAASDATLNLDATTLVTTGEATLGTLSLANGSTVQIDGSTTSTFGKLTLDTLTSDSDSTFLIDLGTVTTDDEGTKSASDKLVVTNYGNSSDAITLTLSGAVAGSFEIFQGNSALTSTSNITIDVVDLERGLWIDQSEGIKLDSGLVTVTIQGTAGDPLSLTWNGTTASSTWYADNTKVTNWDLQGNTEYFAAGDTVTFSSTDEKVSKDVVISGQVAPAAIIVNSTANYNFTVALVPLVSSIVFTAMALAMLRVPDPCFSKVVSSPAMPEPPSTVLSAVKL